MIYIITDGILILLWIVLKQKSFEGYSEKLRLKIFYFTAAIFLGLIMGLRGVDVGTDTQNYFNSYNTIAHDTNFNLYKLHVSLDLEYGYIIYMKCISVFFDNYIFFQLLTSFIICGLLCKFLYDNSTTPLLSLLILLPETYLLGFNIQRQILATVLVLTAFTYLRKNKNFKCLVLLIIAYYVHLTTLFSIPIFIFYRLRNIKYLIKIEPILLIIFILLFNIILSFFSDIHAYANYMSNHKTIQTAGGVKYLWTFEAVLCLYIVYSKHYSNTLKVFAGLGLVYIATQICGLQFNYFERLGTYYLPFITISIPQVFNRLKGRIRTVSKSFVALLFYVYFIISVGGQYAYSFY